MNRDRGKNSRSLSKDETPLPGELKVLLAEDDELNQVLSTGIFKRLGWRLDIVENGERAIEKLRHTVYDVVLMDVQMPVLDGYEATLKIRNELPPPASLVPIIAVTGHTRQCDIDRCRIVGMNDYIYKPFKPDELVAKILALLKGDDQHTLLQKTTEVEKDQVIDLTSLSLTCGDSPDIINNVLTIFLTETPPRITELQQLLQAEDWPNFQVLCHKLKSSFALIGAEAIRKALEEMEHACMKDTVDPERFQTLVGEVVRLNVKADEEIKQKLES